MLQQITQPSGTITFLFTDIVGSTTLWERYPDRMSGALDRHDGLLREAITNHNGFIFKTVGDAFYAAFATAPAAVAAALDAQQALLSEPWPEFIQIKVRMVLHTGIAEERGGDYFGPTLNRIARLMAAGYGGQVLLSDVTQGLARDVLPSTAGLLNMGKQRLKDLGRPEQIFQLLHPALPSDFPPLRSLDSPDLPNNLPQQATSFIGREQEIGKIEALSRKTRLLTLTGSGGSGKSRLSLQIAADTLDQYPNGAWLVELAPLTDPTLVPGAVAQVIGIQAQGSGSMTKTLLEVLQQKCLLIILDNCEHLLSACATLTADLLRSCPQVRILATSREPLGINGEQTYRVPPLTLPPPQQVQTAKTLSQYESVILFIERANLVQPTFTVTDQNAPAIAQICWRLDGIPLALELAAARVRAMPVEQIMVRLDNRFRLLTGGSRTALPRQQTLRALIDWSYDLLTEPEKMLLTSLSVFAGGWTLAAAEVVCAENEIEDWQVLDMLTSLVDKSLVVYEDIASSEARYRLPETLRQYAQERLQESNRGQKLRTKQLEYFCAFTEQAKIKQNGPERLTAFADFDKELDNIRTALRWSLEADQVLELGQRIAFALWTYWGMRGNFSEVNEWLTSLIASGSRTSLWHGRVLNEAGSFARNDFDFARAIPLVKESVEIARQLDDKQGLVQALSGLGGCLLYASQSEQGYSCLEEAVLLAREAGLEDDVHWALMAMAEFNPDKEISRSLLLECLALCEVSGDHGAAHAALNSLAWNDFHDGNLDSAVAKWEKILESSREMSELSRAADAMTCLGIASRQRGALCQARTYFEEALAIARPRNFLHLLDYTQINLVRIAREQRNFAEARRHLVSWRPIGQKLYGSDGITRVLQEAAHIAISEEQWLLVARLLGALNNHLDTEGINSAPEDKKEIAPFLTAVRDALPSEDFARAWAEGAAMPLEHVIQYGLTQPAS